MHGGLKDYEIDALNQEAVRLYHSLMLLLARSFFCSLARSLTAELMGK